MSYKHDNLIPNYAEVEQLLSQYDTELSPAECQGIALGLLVWDKQDRAQEKWSDTLIRELNANEHIEITPELSQSLQTIYDFAGKSLQDQAFGLQIYLPDDNSALADRTYAISQWCRGFMFGLGLMGFDSRMLSNPLINESIQDISQIMNIESDMDEEQEANEKDFFELVEYLRMAVLLINSEITGSSEESGKSVHGYH